MLERQHNQGKVLLSWHAMRCWHSWQASPRLQTALPTCQPAGSASRQGGLPALARPPAAGTADPRHSALLPEAGPLSSDLAQLGIGPRMLGLMTRHWWCHSLLLPCFLIISACAFCASVALSSSCSSSCVAAASWAPNRLLQLAVQRDTVGPPNRLPPCAYRCDQRRAGVLPLPANATGWQSSRQQ